ncbi:MAG: efflux RND transporter periplasmic adaptor subunit [Erysipelotrichaceae bacterium]|nr:efflux RND transporter periplasmic adaptor subunit [Erysipelotrichaceae bacterium]
MKIGKKILIGLGILLAIGIIYIIFFMKAPTGDGFNSGVSIDMGMEDASSDIVETTSGVIYTGKVIPLESRYYMKDATKEYKDTYVNEKDEVLKGTILFDYVYDYSIDAQIKVTQNNFVTLQEQLDDYYSRIQEYKEWLEGVDSEDTGYKSYLESEIIKTEGLIAQNKVDWIKAEESIRKLNESKDDYTVKSEIDGIVYQIIEDNTTSSFNTSSAYITIYSKEKIVRINVSEYEYNLFNVGEKVSVEIEGLNKTFNTNIKFKDILPNNLESTETSYYNVDITIPDEVPYGYTAKITVSK